MKLERGRVAPLLDTETVRQLERLSFAPLDALLEGAAGNRRTRRSAPGIEFEDHRAYVPGDDLRSLDWNVYARLRETVVRTSPGEGRLSVALLLDTSRSMRAGRSGNSYGAALAAVLGAAALLHSDSLVLWALADGKASDAQTLQSREALQALVDQLQRMAPGGLTDLPSSMETVTRAGETPDVAVLISDLLMSADQERAFERLAAWAPSATVAHVIDPAAARPSPAGVVELRDSETGERLTVRVTQALADHYAQAFDARVRALIDACERRGVMYVACPTDAAPLEVLTRGFRAAGVVRADTS